jgi:hypothetical protein
VKKLLLLIAATVALAMSATAQAAATIQTETFDAIVTACNGDPIHVTGTLLDVFTETTTPSGGFAVSAHFQPQGIKGVDLVTGTVFLATGLTRDIQITTPRGGATETFVNRFHIQATRGAESFIVSETFHITINANGQITVLIDNFKSTC